MTIYINGVKVAGRGLSGKSPYQIAVENGYTGSEAAFNQQLAAIGKSIEEVDAAIEEANQIINNAQTEFDTAINTAKQDINTMIEETEASIAEAVSDAQQAAADAVSTADNALIEIQQAKDDALAAVPNVDHKIDRAGDTMSGYLTLHADPTADMHAVPKQYVDAAIASLVTDIFSYGASAPANTKLLWIDSNATTGGLKFYNGSSWVHVPVAWS